MKTLDEVIEEELAKGKKLGEIKVSSTDWLSNRKWFVPFFQDAADFWHGLFYEACKCKGVHEYYSDISQGWYVCTEPKKLKRFWQWAIKTNTCWFKEVFYLDDRGRDTSGKIHYYEWNTFEKQKCENEFIEIEVEE